MNRFSTLLLLSLLLMAGACSDGEVFESKKQTETEDSGGSGTTTTTISEETKLADQFAIDALSVYYLWIDDDDIKSAVETKLNPETCTDPISAVKEVRSGEDRWTAMYDDVSALTNSLNGTETTMGQYMQVGTIGNKDGTYFLLVCYVYPGSPAEKAGVKRGDIYISYNGADITDSNLEEAYYGTTTATYGMAHIETTDDGGYRIKDDGTSVSLTPVVMYEDPVLCAKTFDVEGKKVGYLAYAGFDMASCSKLIETCKGFKSEGVSELVLDLRYNGGGYVFTEELLASMLAPEANVAAGDVYEKEVYNALLTKYWGDTSTSYFRTAFSRTDSDDATTDYSTADANIGLQKIYALVSDNTASASESIIVGLMPYMDIDVIGTQTHGKFCTGVILAPDDVYKSAPAAIEDWGIYVMIGSYSDKDGNNPCRPDGLTPDTAVSDAPFDGFQLGDENETMLKAALSAAGKSYTATRSLSRTPYLKTRALHGKTFGMRIRTHLPQMAIAR